MLSKLCFPWQPCHMQTLSLMVCHSYVCVCGTLCDSYCCWLIFSTCFALIWLVHFSSHVSAMNDSYYWFFCTIHSEGLKIGYALIHIHTHTLCTHAHLILESFCAAKVTSITHALTLSLLCKTKTGKLISLFLCCLNFPMHFTSVWVNFAAKICLECREQNCWELKM